MEMCWEWTRVDEDLEAEIRQLAQEIQRAAERLAEVVQERDRGWSR